MTNDSARIVRSQIYSDFGSSLVDTSAANTPTLNRLYAGYSWDGSPANFYWMLGRQSYDPTIGRFEQEDPLLQTAYSTAAEACCFPYLSNHTTVTLPRKFDWKSLPHELNGFSYVTNNPVNTRDPSGEIGIGGAVIVLAIGVWTCECYFCARYSEILMKQIRELRKRLEEHDPNGVKVDEGYVWQKAWELYPELFKEVDDHCRKCAVYNPMRRVPPNIRFIK